MFKPKTLRRVMLFGAIGVLLVIASLASRAHAGGWVDMDLNGDIGPTVTAYRSANFAMHIGGFVDGKTGLPTNLAEPRYEYMKLWDYKRTQWLRDVTGETWPSVTVNGVVYSDFSKPSDMDAAVRAVLKWFAQIHATRIHMDCVMECPPGQEDNAALLVEKMAATGLKVMPNNGDPYTAGITDIKTPWGRINAAASVICIQVGVDFDHFNLSRFVYTMSVVNYYVAHDKSVIVGGFTIDGKNEALAKSFFSAAIFNNPLVFKHYNVSYAPTNVGLQIPGGKAVVETPKPDLGLLTPLGGTLYVPTDNWWNLDVSTAPLDPNNAAILAAVASYETTKGRIHPDFGGGYGIPYCVVDGNTPLVPVAIGNTAESDKGYPGAAHGYPIPDAAKTNSNYFENAHQFGSAGNTGDSHLLIYDRDRQAAFELSYAKYSGGQWSASYGAVFKLDSNYRRPEGWTSTDAAGLCVLAGLVRYDEVYGSTQIKQATRVSVKQVGLKFPAAGETKSKGYVWPASHQGSTDAGGLPLGTRFRLKSTFNTSGYPAPMRKLFDSWKVFGLIVADRGGNGFIQGTLDSRWSNDVLNPAFHSLVLSRDFEVITLGWKP